MKLSTSFFAFLAVCLFVPLLGFGQVAGDYQSTGGVGNWNDPTKWQVFTTSWVSATEYPGQSAGTGDVTILNTSTITINISPNYAIGSITVKGSLSFDGNASNNLVVTGLVKVTSGKSFIVASGTGSINTLTIGGNLSNNGTMDMYLSPTNYCDIICNGSSNQKIQNTASDLHDVTIATTSGATVTFTTVPTINGDLSVTTGTLITGDITLASGKNLSVSDDATLSLTGNSMVGVSGTGTKTFGTTSTVDYSGGGAQAVTAEDYGNLNFSGSGSKTLPAVTINVAGNFTTSGSGGTSAATNPINITGDVSLSGGPAAFNAGSATITVGGSWNKAGANSFTQGTSTVIFKDSPDIEVISGASTTFYNLTIDGSTISLDKKIEVQNTFSLLNENLILNNFSLTLSNATGLSGGSSSSYVVTNGTGRFIRTIGGSGTYLFPLGSAAGYDQATMTWSSSPGATQISSNFNSTPLINPTGLTSTIYGGIEPTPITEFLDNGYWDFTADVTPNVFDLTLVADAVNNMGANDSFHSIFRSPNTGASGWTDAGTSPVPSAFSTSTITLQMSGVTFMRFYGIGRSEEYILPIVLVDFDGSNVGNANVLNWTTATELNNDYFTIERSLDGKSYEEIGTVAGAGQSSTLLNYEYTDAQPYLGTNYYRLKQTDYNGAFDYSNVISIKVNGNFEMGYPYPNPVVNNVSMNILSANSGITYLRIFDMTGREMYAEKIAVNEGLQTFAIDMTNFASGMYISEIEIDGVSYRNTILK
ncbi:MAG: T9SS type A sorting domain-containing protein [Bacteroidetes bacterium]|nr:T9SS type A sorting domain-containing protein [Bacteroidota bacterium]